MHYLLQKMRFVYMRATLNLSFYTLSGQKRASSAPNFHIFYERVA